MNTIYDNTFVLGQTSATNFVAGPGIKIDEPSAGTVRIGWKPDETVLYNGPIGNFNTELTISEPFSGFEYIGVANGNNNSNAMFNLYPSNSLDQNRIAFNLNWGVNYMINAYLKFTPVDNSSGLKYKYVNNTVQVTTHNSTTFSIYQNDTSYVTSSMPIKVIGINRKEVENV